MATRTFFIVQHGEKQQHRVNPGLTDRGRRQADAVTTALRNTDVLHLHSSPLLRARQTAEPLARAQGLPVDVDAGLTERMDWSPSGGTLEEFLVQWGRASRDRNYQPSTGDSSRSAGQRFEDALRRFVAADADGTVVVVSHGGITVDFLRNVIDDAAWTPWIEQLVEDRVPGGAITEVTLLGDDWCLQRLACLDHLADADRSGHRLV